MRATSRLAGVSMNAVVKLNQDAGAVAMTHHDKVVRNVHAERVECDEIWSFCYAKGKSVPNLKSEPHDVAGSVWTWTAIDPDSK